MEENDMHERSTEIERAYPGRSAGRTRRTAAASAAFRAHPRAQCSRRRRPGTARPGTGTLARRAAARGRAARRLGVRHRAQCVDRRAARPRRRDRRSPPRNRVRSRRCFPLRARRGAVGAGSADAAAGRATQRRSAGVGGGAVLQGGSARDAGADRHTHEPAWRAAASPAGDTRGREPWRWNSVTRR